jgi:GNAT superfamily N-acetyltransferase
MNITSRRAVAADITTIAMFNQSMARETEDKLLATKTIMSGVEHMVENTDLGFYLVAEAEGGVVGCLGITYEWSDWRNGLFWWIQSVFVDKEYRGQGAFRQLYDHVTRLAKEEPKVCGIRLYVEDDNTGARHTYAALGMTETSYKLLEVEF